MLQATGGVVAVRGLSGSPGGATRFSVISILYCAWQGQQQQQSTVGGVVMAAAGGATSARELQVEQRRVLQWSYTAIAYRRDSSGGELQEYR